MKIDWKVILRNKVSSTKKSSVDKDEIEYDKHADFYYTNLINSLILFSLTTEELEKLAGPVFNPMTELECKPPVKPVLDSSHVDITSPEQDQVVSCSGLVAASWNN